MFIEIYPEEYFRQNMHSKLIRKNDIKNIVKTNVCRKSLDLKRKLKTIYRLDFHLYSGEIYFENYIDKAYDVDNPKQYRDDRYINIIKQMKGCV